MIIGTGLASTANAAVSYTFSFDNIIGSVTGTVEGADVTNWQTRGENTFTVVNGVITDYQFGASEGAIPTLMDSVPCLNNGGSFNMSGIYFCGAQESFLGCVNILGRYGY